ncbi:MAG: hypothetical protein KDE53_01350 [Caldilineaceae bacterium]|nr:hypothetical protein [Caldilineaceae bacterium]
MLLTITTTHQPATDLGYLLYKHPARVSVAISQVYGSALAGTSRGRPQLAEMPLPLEATVAVVPSRGGADLMDRM